MQAAAPSVPLAATIHVHNSRIFYRDKETHEPRYLTPAVARDAIKRQKELAGMGDREAATLTAAIDAIEADAARSAKAASKGRSTGGNDLDRVLARADNLAEKILKTTRTTGAPRTANLDLSSIVDVFPLRDAGGELKTREQRASEAAAGVDKAIALATRATPAPEVQEAAPAPTFGSIHAIAVETIEVGTHALDDLKGQPKAIEWLREMQSKVLHSVARVTDGKPSDLLLSGALVGPQGVGKKLAAEIYTRRLFTMKAITEPKLHVIDLRRLLDDELDLETVIKGTWDDEQKQFVGGIGDGVVLIENAHVLDREEHAKELRVIEGLAGGAGEPVLLLSGEPELRSLIDGHWRLKDALKTQVLFDPLKADVLCEMFLAEAKKDGYEVDEEGKAAVAGRFRSMGKGSGDAVEKLLFDAKTSMALRLYPDGELPQQPLSKEDLVTLRAADLKTADLGEIDKLPAIVAFNKRIGQKEAKVWARTLAFRIAEDRRRQADGKKVAPLNLNIVITGDQGTGKTSIVEFINDLLHDLGQRNGKIVYRTASEIKGAARGQAETNVRDMYRDADGGMVVVDEAHVLPRDEFGQKVLEALTPLAWNNRENTTSILIGYEEPMLEIFKVDQGLGRRFPLQNRVKLQPYTRDELRDLVLDNAERLEYELDLPTALEMAMRILDIQKSGKDFGNAGAVENLVLAATTAAAARDLKPGEKRGVLKAEDFGAVPQGVEAIVAELDKYVGLEHIKPKLEALGRAVEDQREAQRPVSEAFDSFALFVGPSGSGRKTVAGVFTGVYASYGLIGDDKTIVRSITSCKGKVLGDSENNVRDMIDRAIGGHLVLDSLGALAANNDSYAQGIVEELKTQLTKNRGRLACSLVGSAEEIEAFFQLDSQGVLRGLFGERYELRALDTDSAVKVLQGKLAGFKRTLHADAEARLAELVTRLIAAPNWQNGLDIEILARRIQTEHSSVRREERYKDWDRDTISLEAVGKAIDGVIANKGGKPSGELWDTEPVKVTSGKLRASALKKK